MSSYPRPGEPRPRQKRRSLSLLPVERLQVRVGEEVPNGPHLPARRQRNQKRTAAAGVA